MSNVKVQLIAPHTHAGVAHPEGEVLEVSEADAQWLADHGVIQQGNKKPRWLKSVPTDHEESK